MVWWLVSLPLEGSKENTWTVLQNKTSFERDLAQSHKFVVPELRIGTLDSLLALSDDLHRTTASVDAVAGKLRRQIDDLERVGDTTASASLPAGGVDSALTRFVWDEAKHPVKAPLRELVDKIQAGVAHQDDELKLRAGEYQSLKNQLTAISRKATGSLLVRDLSGLVSPDDVVDTEHLTTLLVVVPRYQERDWLAKYETLSQFVVPRSSKQLAEESDYSLFTVTLFRKVADAFKAAARELSFQVREYDHNVEANAAKDEQLATLRRDMETKQAALAHWVGAAYAEVLSDWLHLLAIRVFAESILRYGLPPRFLAAMLKPNPKTEKKLRDVLATTFGKSSGGSIHWQDNDGGNEMPGLDGGAEIQPYVSFTLNVE